MTGSGVAPASQPQAVRGGGEIRSLTGLRFLAAFHVMLFHNTVGFHSHLPGLVIAFINMGDLGVTLFFVLSGFVLAYTYRGRARENLPGFWSARFARVYPVYLLGLVAAVPIFITDRLPEMQPHQVAVTLVSVLTLTQAWFPASACKLNCPGWSLSVELVFYLLFPFLAAGLARLGRRPLLAVALTCVVASFAFQFLQPLVTDALYPRAGFPNEVRLMVGANPLYHIPSFVIGVCLGLWYASGGVLPAAAVVTATAAGVAVVLYASGSLLDSVVRESVLLPLYAVIVLGLASHQTGLSRWLATPSLVLLGKASYALYLLHASLSPLAKRYLFDPGADRADGSGYITVMAFFALYFSGAVLISVAVYHFIEEPARQWLRRALSGRSKAAA